MVLLSSPMIAESLAALKVGAWYTYCCHLDLYQVRDEEERQEIEDSLRNPDPLIPKVWVGWREALSDIRTWDESQDIRNEITSKANYFEACERYAPNADDWDGREAT